MSAVTNNVKEFYSNDLVYKFDDEKKIVFGLVRESYEASDTDDFSALQKGQIIVLWNNSDNHKQIIKQSKVHLLSRNVLAGDIVRRLQDGVETQRGYCRTNKQTAAVQIVESDRIIEHIPCNRLYYVTQFEVGDAACLGDKFGRIQSIDRMIKMQSKCGSIVEVRSSMNYGIRDYWNTGNVGYYGPAYPGQTVMCTPMKLKDPRWLKKSKIMKRRMEITQTFTILSIELCLVEVWWCALNGNTEYAELKEDEIKKLKVLQCSDDLVVHDRYLLKLRPSDDLLRKKEWRHQKSLLYLSDKVPNEMSITESAAELIGEVDEDWCTEEDDDSDNNVSLLPPKPTKTKRKKKHRPVKLHKFVPGSVVAVEIIVPECKATIIWQDGTEEKDVPTTELYYSVSLDEHEFFPGEWVVPNLHEDGEKYGVVQKVNFAERTAQVRWFEYSASEQKPLELETNEVSVYDLKKHPKYVFRPDSVVKAIPVQKDKMGKVIDSCPQGYVIVEWLDGTMENCYPQNIELIPEIEELDYPDDFTSDGDLTDDGYSWETETVESFEGDVIDDINLQNMASKVDFVRSRINYLREAFRQHGINQNFHFVKDLLCVYDNSSYLDKYLGTSFFSLESSHFQALLMEAKKKAKSLGIELRGRLFSRENLVPVTKMKNAEKENIQRMIKLETEINAQIECNKENGSTNPENLESGENAQNNLLVELLLMLKIRLDLAYAEIISRMGGPQALTVLSNASENSMKPSGSQDFQNLPSTPDEIFNLSSPSFTKVAEELPKNDTFCIIDEAPTTHYHYPKKFEPKDLQKFLNTLQKEYKLLKESLPPGVWVRCYDNRIDLLSVMIRGPAKTPYEDGLFLFDMQLSTDYPHNPPFVHYISYSDEQLNPNLYVEGKVCVSLLGTWMGRGSEVWTSTSTLLQLIVSIQGLILVAEPYYNEAGYERQTHTQQGYENSRTYNEYVLLKLVQSMTEVLNGLPNIFRDEILEHFTQNGEKMCERLLKYCDDSEPLKPEFPLLPVSKGLKLSLNSALNSFRATLKKATARSEQPTNKPQNC